MPLKDIQIIFDAAKLCENTFLKYEDILYFITFISFDDLKRNKIHSTKLR